MTNSPRSREEDTVTDRRESGSREPADSVAAHLFVAVECARPGAGGARHSLAGVTRTLIVRSAGPRSAERAVVDGVPTLVVAIPDRHVSSRHAVVETVGQRLVVRDLGSRNGTRLNGKATAGAAALTDGDVLEIGHTLLVFRAAVPAPFDAPADYDSAQGDLPAGLATLDAVRQRSARQLQRVAASTVPVLVLGATGTGKELVARAVHDASGRRGPFVAVNCGALAPSVLEAQLFGHVRGAYSGAVGDSPGLLRAASGGTLFLDEVAELTPVAQVALLRALQEQEVLPVGGVRPVSIDVRVVAATLHSLDDLCADGAFRSDLHARLAGYTFRLPCLRERREDLGLLLSAIAGDRTTPLDPDAARALLQYTWPHNVREFKHVLDAAAALAAGGAIELAHLPPAVAEAAGGAPAGGHPVHEKLLASLRTHRGNVTQTARELDTSRTQVQRWMRRFGIDPEAFRR